MRADASQVDRGRNLGSFMARRVLGIAALLLAAATVVVGVRLGSKTAGGSDSYGYVSEADLWLKGDLWVSQPWADDVPWANAVWSFTPLGYKPGPARWIVTPPIPHPPRDRWAIVPTYAPGLPLLMAGTKRIAGHCAMFWIVPLLGGAMVLATFGIGVRLGSPVAGLAGAWLTATSPSFLSMVMAPMSDVPAAAAWTLAFWCLLGRSTVSGAGAGLAAGAAVLIRPNLVPLGSLLVLWLAIAVWRAAPLDRPRHVWRLVLALAGLGAGAMAVAVINWVLYGSPWLSGYGSLAGQFSWANLLPNIKSYAVWFTSVHTPLALAGLAALAVPARGLWPGTPDRGVILLIGAFTGGLWLMYCSYQVFDTSFYLRFLLPSWPFIMIGLATVLMAPARWSRRRVVAAAATVAMVLLGVRGIREADRAGWFSQREGESRYVTAGKFTRLATPDNSVVLAMQHSGSLRYYGGRMTIQYDSLGPSSLDGAVAWLADRGVHAYALLDGWEVPRFRARFTGQTTIARLDTPVFQYRDMTLYDLRPPSGPPPETWQIPDSAADLQCRPPAPAPSFVLKQ
jgi:hypothetical protein